MGADGVDAGESVDKPQKRRVVELSSPAASIVFEYNPETKPSSAIATSVDADPFASRLRLGAIRRKAELEMRNQHEPQKLLRIRRFTGREVQDRLRVEIGRSPPDELSLQGVRRPGGQQRLRNSQRGAAPSRDIPVTPGLVGDPVERIMTVAALTGAVI